MRVSRTRTPVQFRHLSQTIGRLPILRTHWFDLFVAVVVLVAGALSLAVLAGQSAALLDMTHEGAHLRPWRPVGALGPNSRFVRIAADGWACNGAEPIPQTTVTYAEDRVTIALSVRDAASNCIPAQAVFVHATVPLAQPLGDRLLVDAFATNSPVTGR